MDMAPLTYEALLYIVQNMRALDREEVFATSYPFAEDDGITDEEFLARLTMEAGTKTGIGWIASVDGEPIAAIGISMMWPGVASVWMFATDSWPVLSLSLTKWAKRTILPLMNDANIHRAQCWSMEGHDVAHRWLRMLGATEECVSPGYGREGQTFRLFAWAKGRNF